MDIKSLTQEELAKIREEDKRKDYTPYYKTLEEKGSIVVPGHAEKLIVALRIHYGPLKRKVHVHRLPKNETAIYLDE